MGRDRLVPLGLVILAGVLLIVRPTDVPPPCFDEGWIMSVAQNWVELGHYGEVMNGMLISPGMLNVGFPAIAPIALSFGLFGVGIRQGRLPGALFTLGSLTLIYYLSRRLYGPAVASGTLATLLLMSILPLIIFGKKALGEMPAVFYLLAGYVCFMSSWRRPILFVPLAAAFWGLAVATKLQVLPFFTLSLLVPLCLALLQHRRKSAGLLALGLLGALVTFAFLQWVQESLLHDQMLPQTSSGVYSGTAFVLVLSVRIAALRSIIIYGLTTLLGLTHTTRRCLGTCDGLTVDTGVEVVRIALLALVGSWTTWYVLLSVGWVRYLFPPAFLGSIFFAVLVSDMTGEFDLAATLKRSALAVRLRSLSLQNVGALAGLVLVSITMALTLRVYLSFFLLPGGELPLVVDLLNTQTARDSLIETYDMELFPLLHRRYHHPSDQVQLQLNRRTFMGQDVPIDYDPLDADPDYLVVGPQSRFWRLYDSVLESGEFRLLRAFRRYDVYRRVRQTVPLLGTNLSPAG